MADFAPAAAVLLDQERGFVADPADPGGATQWGISLRYLRQLGDLARNGWPDGYLDHDGDVDAEDIRALPVETALAIYRRDWWDRLGYGQLASQPLATKMLSLAVNMGETGAAKCLQRALRACASGRPSLLADGRVGPRTIAAANQFQPVALLAPLRSEAAGYYRALVAQRPALRRFLAGWENRAYA